MLETITFSEPEIESLLTNESSGTPGITRYSDPFNSFPIKGAVFTAVSSDGSRGWFYFRTTFDNRTPYPYNFIASNVMQIHPDGLRIDFATQTRVVAFGAALDATSAPSSMQIRLFGPGGVDLGTRGMSLVGRSSNSEGAFYVSGVGEIVRIVITNLGDGVNPASRSGWVIDNVTFERLPM